MANPKEIKIVNVKIDDDPKTTPGHVSPKEFVPDWPPSYQMEKPPLGQKVPIDGLPRTLCGGTLVRLLGYLSNDKTIWLVVKTGLDLDRGHPRRTGLVCGFGGIEPPQLCLELTKVYEEMGSLTEVEQTTWKTALNEVE